VGFLTENAALNVPGFMGKIKLGLDFFLREKIVCFISAYHRMKFS
jgi:hypothetical protein